jgi:dTDP-4-dehydrorhamnose reductase
MRASRRVAIVGASGQLGSELVQAFTLCGDEVLALSRPKFDITRRADLEWLAAQRLGLVVNAAAWTDVDACAREPERALLINGHAAGWVAAVADEAGALIIHVSTNEVFHGRLVRPYVEKDTPRPINPYGASKLAGERAVCTAARRHLVVRTAWIYGGERSFPTKIRAAAAKARTMGQPLRVVSDEFGNPTPASALADRIVKCGALAESFDLRLIHLAGQPPISRYDWAVAILHDADDLRLEPIRLEDYPRPSRAPRRAILASSWADELELRIDWLSQPA